MDGTIYYYKLLLFVVSCLLIGAIAVDVLPEADQVERAGDSHVLQDSPVLLDESNVFDNIKSDFRNTEVPHSGDAEVAQQNDNADSTVEIDSAALEKSELLNVTSESDLDSNSMENKTVNEKNVTEAKYRCVLRVLEEGEVPKLQVMNSTFLLRALSPVPNVTSGECALIVFYSPWCIFSAKAAPHLNALPRLFPHFAVYALDVVTFANLNMRYGLVAIPTLMLFYNGKAVARFNDSELIVEKIVAFVHKYTGITHHGNLSLTEEEMLGPLSPVPAERRDYILILSWLIIIACSCGWFLQSNVCHKMVEGILNTWREVEDQHEHVD